STLFIYSTEHIRVKAYTGGRPSKQFRNRGGSSSLCLRRRDEDCLHHHRSPSRRSDSQTPGESGVPRPGPVRAARATAGRRQFLAMNSNEGRWSIRLISIPRLRTLPVCPSEAPNVARIRWGERIFHKRGSSNLLSGPKNRVSLPNKVPPLASRDFRCVRDRMSYSLVCPVIRPASVTLGDSARYHAVPQVDWAGR